MRETRAGVLWLVGAAILWGTTGTTRALAPQEIHPLALGAARLVVAAAALGSWAWWRARRREAGGGTRARPGRGGGEGPDGASASSSSPRALPASRFPRPALAIAALGIAAYQATFFVGVMRLGVGTGTVVAIGSAPIFAGVLGRVVRGERLEVRWVIATTLALLGLALLVPPASAPDLVGLACAIGAGLAYAAYAAASKPLVDAKGPDVAMAGAFGAAAVLTLPFLLLPGTGALLSPGGALAIAHLGILATAVAYLLFARGIAQLRVATAATVSLIEPATAVTLGVLVLHERVDIAGVLGIAAILGGVVLLALGPRRGHADI